MSNYQDNKEEENSKEAAKIERFVQTYLIISSLLLIRYQNAVTLLNKTDITQSTFSRMSYAVDATFLYFAISILLYYIFVQEKISDYFAGFFAFIASLFLSLQIVNSVATRYLIEDGINKIPMDTLAVLYVVLTMLISYTLIPKNCLKKYVYPLLKILKIKIREWCQL